MKKNIWMIVISTGLALGGTPTEGNETANILAHGVWGAMEAASQGGSALGGAAAAMTGEAGAKLLAEQLYGQSNPEHLFTEQKQTLSELSQVLAGATAGTVSGATGGNSLTAVQAVATGMGVAKSAVENNYLSQFSQKRKAWLKEQLQRKDLSSVQREKYETEFIELERDDHTSDILVTKAKNTPEKMTKLDWQLYHDYVTRYYLENIALSGKPNVIENNLNDILLDNHIKNYSYPYATASEYRRELPSRWNVFGLDKAEDEVFYSDINNKYYNRQVYKNSFNGKLATSTAEALGYAGLVNPAGCLLTGIPRIGELAAKYPTLSEMAIIGVVNTGAQLSSKEPYTYSSLIEAELSYLLTRKDSASVAWSKNMLLGTYMEQAEKQEKEIRFGIKEDPEYFKKGLSVTFGSLVSKGSDKTFSSSQSSYIHNLIKPTTNAIFSEGVPKVIDKVEDSINKTMEDK
ncbi:VENN motif pre-toxin domain-containing protein [Glaesserella parasuis]|uniref:VENN motif pre-toxin domain-containing protein n=2 Tax=Glaesserella parasuis TaxID=738 RepID=A0A6M8T0G4_GLAPU|nr:VENN motif pre-toxin domain-containing protein [Glaesserella parasuis]MDD2169258.1 VENN motif pre-toxin domain-containing protein [Glaesserella parasuis]MDO9874564.1 VENN motif pre-toxin domain-containing protein [Glaesserella parasuis]MDO9914332.1 VENN motif pre-toxin domain-containing protein [Glaesserella parasuis]MDP0351638.1 VENN motif pre-toxin domain-containing protein [Glaesserella parasuis]MDP0393410.1 VENN motif pre-toxin domain-containing protein [Glaesserella parasuis]